MQPKRPHDAMPSVTHRRDAPRRFVVRSWSHIALLGGVVACSAPQVGPPPPLPTLEGEELAVAQTLTDMTLTWKSGIQSTSAASVDRAEWELVVDQKVVDKGAKPLGVVVAANALTPLTFSQAHTYVATPTDLKNFDARGGSMFAALRGVLVLRSGAHELRVPFARSREVRVPRLPRVVMQDFDAARYAADDAHINFHLGVVNPNPFQVVLGQLGYTIEVAGKKVAEGALGTSERVEPSSTGVFDIAASVNTETHGKEVTKLVKGLVMPYVVKGNLSAALFNEPFEAKGDIRLPVQK